MAPAKAGEMNSTPHTQKTGRVPKDAGCSTPVQGCTTPVNAKVLEAIKASGNHVNSFTVRMYTARLAMAEEMSSAGLKDRLGELEAVVRKSTTPRSRKRPRACHAPPTPGEGPVLRSQRATRCLDFDESSLDHVLECGTPEMPPRPKIWRPSTGTPRGKIDSGKGVRKIGGKTYDSARGTTCHYCRQKTLSYHVTCTAPECNGVCLPRSFCETCLANRHGEDAAKAEASKCWICPCCRGSCGDGCRGCCTCSICRRHMGLLPTGQVVEQAREEGFSNVHDYMVHKQTGETPAQISARKLKHAWGAFLRADASADTKPRPP